MKAKITLTAKKTWTEEYPDNDFSDEVIIDNFWNQTFNQDEFDETITVTVVRKQIGVEHDHKG
jgi:hypothetical protein